MADDNDFDPGCASIILVALIGVVFFLSLDFTYFMVGKTRDEIDHLRTRVEALEYWNGTTEQEGSNGRTTRIAP